VTRNLSRSRLLCALTALLAAFVLLVPSPGSAKKKTRMQILRFHPLDSNNHNTVLFFYNPGTAPASVTLDFETDAGAPCLSGTTFDVPPRGSVRFSADSLDAGSPASWSSTVVYNVFDTCEVGFVTMPRALTVSGYVAWTATDTYNPRDLNPHAPIVFTPLKKR
jgi:hypothetical protein